MNGLEAAQILAAWGAGILSLWAFVVFFQSMENLKAGIVTKSMFWVGAVLTLPYIIRLFTATILG